MQTLRNVLGSRAARRACRIVGLAVAVLCIAIFFQSDRPHSFIVWAQQSPCPTGSVPLAAADISGGSATRQFACQRTSDGAFILPGAQFVSNINGVIYVGGGLPQVGSSADMGAQINAAYAALPSNGGVIRLIPNAAGTCYNYSTPIVFSTLNKYIRLEGESVSTVGTAGNICLNYTPTTATSAVTLDYAGNNATPSADHGLSNIKLINNLCVATGGCGSSAIGIDTGTTNFGNSLATMQNDTVDGFGIAYRNNNSLSDDVLFVNFVANANTTVMSFANGPGPLTFLQGTIAGNGKILTETGTNPTPGLVFYNTIFFGNTASIPFDFTGGTSPNAAGFECYGCHLENSPALGSHYIQGVVDVSMFGGLVEDDNATASDWFFNLTCNTFTVHGTKFVKSTTNITNIAVINSPCKGELDGMIGSPGHFNNNTYIGGAASGVLVNLQAGNASSASSNWYQPGDPISLNASLGYGHGAKLNIPSRNSATPAAALLTTLMSEDGSINISLNSFDSALGVGCTGNTTITWTVSYTDRTNTAQNFSPAVQTITTNGGATGQDRYSAVFSIDIKAGTAVNISNIYTPGAGCTTNPGYSADFKMIF